MVWRYQPSFATGELSGDFHGRTDLAIYPTAARKLENAFVKRSGSTCKRYGTLYNSETYQSKVARLGFFHALSPSVDLKVVLVFTDDELRLFDGDTGAALNGGAAIAVPYQEADLDGLSFKALPDELAIFHENYETRSFSVAVGAPYTFTFAVFDTGNSGPRLNSIRRLVTMQRGTFILGELYEWNTNTDYWRETDEGSIFWMEGGFVHVFDVGGAKIFINPKKVRGNQFVNHSPTTTGPSENWQGQWQPGSLTGVAVAQPAAATINAPYTLTRASGSWSKSDVGKIIDPTPSSGPYQLLFLIVEYLTTTTVKALLIRGSTAGGAGDANHRLYTPTQRDKFGRAMLTPSAKTGTITIYSDRSDTFDLTLDDGTEQKPLVFLNGGVARLVSVVSGSEITATTIYDLMHQVPSTTWALGPSMTYGFPRTGFVHQNRLGLMGFKGRFGRTMALSRSASYHEFMTGVNDDDAFQIEIVGETGRLSWAYSGTELVFGSDSGKVYRLSGNPVTPTELGVDVQADQHGAPVEPIQIGTEIHFVDHHREELLSVSFRWNTERYEADRVSVWAGHLFVNGAIREFHHMDGKNPIYLLVHDTGDAVVFSRDDKFGTLAFSPWPGLRVLSACIVPRGTGDVAFLVVERTINGGTKRYIEVLDPAMPILDSAKLFSSPGSTTLTGLGHLEAATVRVVVDGDDVGTAVVSGGSAVVPAIGTAVYVGLGFDYRLRPQYIPGSYKDSGSSEGRMEGVSGAMVLVSEDTEGLTHEGRDLVPQAPSVRGTDDPRTKWLRVDGITNRAASPTFDLVHSKATPCEVMAVDVDYTLIGSA